MPVILGRATCSSGVAAKARAMRPASMQATTEAAAEGRSGIPGSARFDPRNLGHALAEAQLKALIGRAIPGVADEVVGQALHVRHLVLVVVRVLVAFAV